MIKIVQFVTYYCHIYMGMILHTEILLYNIFLLDNNINFITSAFLEEIVESSSKRVDQTSNQQNKKFYI